MRSAAFDKSLTDAIIRKGNSVASPAMQVGTNREVRGSDECKNEDAGRGMFEKNGPIPTCRLVVIVGLHRASMHGKALVLKTSLFLILKPGCNTPFLYIG
jgi:hypothetical protein